MSGICFHWELPASISANPKAVKKLLLHWSHTAKCFGIKDIYLIDVDKTGAFIGDNQVNCKVIKSLDELKGKLVFVEQGGKSLTEFKHPKDCIYVFGSDYGSLPKADVSIEAELPLYAEQACAIVLYDRSIKCGSHK